MPLKPRDTLPVPPDDLLELRDHERKILGGPVYNLDEVKDYVVKHGRQVIFLATQKAGEDLVHDLRWNFNDICGFIACLGSHHYRGSEWCYASEKAKVAYPADVYIMGYSKVKRAEWPQLNPWTYLKFSFTADANTIDVFSIHTEKKK